MRGREDVWEAGGGMNEREAGVQWDISGITRAHI